jgi:hypothetical protein
MVLPFDGVLRATVDKLPLAGKNKHPLSSKTKHAIDK